MEESLKSGRGRRCYRIRVLRRDSRSESCRPNRDSADGDQHSSTGTVFGRNWVLKIYLKKKKKKTQPFNEPVSVC